MILVTGATGTVGREVVRRLPADAEVRVLTRDPARVTGADHATVLRGDYGDPSSLDAALRGVRSAFLVTTRVAGDQDARFLRAARAAGVEHVVKLSAAGVEDPAADDLIARWQRENEELLFASGLAWTLLRPRSFMSNTLSWAPAVRTEDVVRDLYGESPNACIDPGDIAEVAVRALTGPGHAGRAYTLTGPEAVTAVERTAQLAHLLGRPLRFEELGPERARSRWSERYPPAVVEALLRSARRQREGAKAQVTQTFAGLVGRPPRTFREWAADHLDSFSGN
ncbi:NAD(P)H-binding protein [Streptomyces lancefieldiae]|uniref:NAD(P)H-binding protein n=1 Tax=Streptomyces lancefieldiae TaxID=3075520 RepID=A0ABU3ASB6_9ACTN|nr:NAD(P)H-binding protein [Streptomyces sp. DSM 40712]MDT0612750.1 NAD(P)H-binding protein [Streptomyces sp. DSM 40712]